MKPLHGRARFLAFRWIGILAALVLLLPATSSAQPLDLTNPDDIVKANRKIQSSLIDGKPTIIYFEGNVFSRIAGEKDRLLFTYQGMNIRATQTVIEEGRGYGYRIVTREVVIYLDPETKEVLRTWKNPWTGEEVEVAHIANDPVNWGTTFAQGPRGPAKWRATCIDDWCSQRIEVPDLSPNPLGGDYQEYVGGDYHAIEIFFFNFRKAEVIAADTTEAPMTVGWARVCQWLPWMKMGGRHGWMIYSGTGGRVASWDSVPETLVKEIEANYPEYKEPPPLDDARPNETSWTYFKKWIDAKRAKEPTKEKEKE